MPGSVSLLSPLLFVQVSLLACTAGILSTRYPLPGLALLALIWLADLKRSASLRHSLWLAAFFCLAFAWACLRTPAIPPLPTWLENASIQQQEPGKELRPPAPLRLSGTVMRCDLLPDGRARVLLQNAHAQDMKGSFSPAAPDHGQIYDGEIVWTWRNPPFIPIPGERVSGLVRLAGVRGFANSGGWDSGEYWRDKGVLFRAWSSGKEPPVRLDPGEPSLFLQTGAWRRNLLLAFRQALPKAPLPGPQAGSPPTLKNRPDRQGDAQQIYTPTAGAALLPALIFGDRSAISPLTNDLFARATLAHSLALSGMHLGFAVLAGAALAAALCKLRPRLCLTLPRPRLALLLSLPFALLYLWLGQAPYSLMRAAAMLLFSTLLVFIKKPRAVLDGLFAALACILVVNPLALFELSLQLSALCVAALALALPHITRLAARLVPARGVAAAAARGAIILLGSSLCIQIALLPLTARAFGTSGLLFPLNVLWLPVLGVIVLPLAFFGLLAAALNLSALAGLLLATASVPCELLLELLTFLDAAGLLAAPALPRPHWLSMAGYWLLLLFLPTLCSRRGTAGRACRLCIPALALSMLLAPPLAAVHAARQPGVTLRLLDVGQGQAVLVEWTGMGEKRLSGRALVDGGGFPASSFDVGKAVLGPVLTDNALPRLDLVASSHADTDHFSGLMYMLEAFSVARYASNGDPTPEAFAAREAKALAAAGLRKQHLQAGDSLALAPELRLDVLWPGQTQSRGNNASLVLRLVWRETPLALLCGDIEKSGLKSLLAQDVDLHAQVLVLPHHGSGQSCIPEFYAKVAPHTALASCGYANRWGFPSRMVRETLAAQNIPLYTTARSGEIRLAWHTPGQPPELTTVLP